MIDEHLVDIFVDALARMPFIAIVDKLSITDNYALAWQGVLSHLFIFEHALCVMFMLSPTWIVPFTFHILQVYIKRGSSSF